MKFAARRILLAFGIGTILCYCITYFAMSRRGIARAREQNVKGFYFVDPSSKSGRTANRALQVFFGPLVFLEIALGTIPQPAAEPLRGIGN